MPKVSDTYDRGYVDGVRGALAEVRERELHPSMTRSVETHMIVDRHKLRHYDPPIECVDGSEIVPAGTLAALLAYVELEESAAPYSSSPMRERARAILSKAKSP
jgi:hypothetical protein